MHDVSDHLAPSIITTPKHVIINNILTSILAMYKTKTIPNTAGYEFTKNIHHHLSHRPNIRDQRIIYQHQPRSLIIPNEHSNVPISHSTFINRFSMSPHLYESNTLIPINTESNAYVIIECERTRTTTLVTQYLQQPLSTSTSTTTNLVLESGWVSFTVSNTHPLNYHRHLAFMKNELPGTLSNHSKHVNFLCFKNFRQVICTCHGYHLPTVKKLSDQTYRAIAFGSTQNKCWLITVP